MNFMMKIVPDPDSGDIDDLKHTVIRPGAGQVPPIMLGNGSLNYMCPGCEEILLQNMNAGQIPYAIFRCPNCNIFCMPSLSG